MPKMPKMPKIPKKPPKLFYEQTVGIRYKAPKQLEAELNKVLGKGNWFASQDAYMDEYVLKVTRLLTDDEIDKINNNLRVHHGG